MPTLTSLPTITRFLGVHDHGPSDGGRGSATCPHCGSDGRYVFTFICDDGTQRGAMSGCVKLFPASEIALEDKRLIERQAELNKQYGPDANLNSWDSKIRDAIDAYYETGDEADTTDVLRTIKNQKAAMAAWRQKKYGGRR